MSRILRTLPARAVVFAGLPLLAAACGGDGASDVGQVMAIESILASDIEIEVDPSATSAVLRVETTIPVACAVVYGTDETLGSIAVDDDMTGGAHDDHGPLLRGLEPETEYRYVLQGSDAAGNLYRSEEMRFTTPAATIPSAADNLAPGGAVTASSEFSARFAAAMAVDGDLATEWSSAGDGDDAWIEIDLGASQSIGGFTYRTRQMSDGTAVVESFTVTLDDEVLLGPFLVAAGPVELPEAVVARVLRFDAVDTTGGNTGAVEVEIVAPS